MEKEVDKYIESKELVLMAYPPEYIEDVKKDMEFAFRAGAKWMAEQGETVEGEIMCAVAHPHENKVVARVNGNYKFGDKVIVQIRKK